MQLLHVKEALNCLSHRLQSPRMLYFESIALHFPFSHQKISSLCASQNCLETRRSFGQCHKHTKLWCQSSICHRSLAARALADLPTLPGSVPFLVFFPRASERRVLLIVGVCQTFSHLHITSSILTSSHPHTLTSSHLLIFTSSHPHILTSSHLEIFTSSHPNILTSSHLEIFTSSHPNILTSSHLLIFTSAHLHIFSSSHLLIFTSSHLHICSSSHLLTFTSSHLLIFTSSHPHILTSSHLHIFSSSHLHILTSSHLHIQKFTSSHLHIFSSSHHIFTSSHLLIFSSSHLHILTSSHPHIFTSSHLHILSCPLALLPSSFSFFSISLLRRGAVPTRRHETQPFRTKRGSIAKNCGKIAVLQPRRRPFCTKWGSIAKN